MPSSQVNLPSPHGSNFDSSTRHQTTNLHTGTFKQPPYPRLERFAFAEHHLGPARFLAVTATTVSQYPRRSASFAT